MIFKTSAGGKNKKKSNKTKTSNFQEKQNLNTEVPEKEV